MLPHFSKILHKLFANRLDDFIEKYEIQNNRQYGISSGQSTILAVMECVENVVTANDKNQHTIDVFSDLPKATIPYFCRHWNNMVLEVSHKISQNVS